MFTLTSLSQDLKRLSLRLEHIVHLDAMASHEVLPDAIRAALMSDFREVIEVLSKQAWLRRAAGVIDGPTLENAILESVEAADGPFGWLVKARQPEFFVAGNREYHWSGARVRSVWLYADTYDAALASAIEWAEAYSQEVWGETEA
ncbi:hypothetical protein CR51_35985 [Caballeronia megalochromosomata]|nr:hypothetical protein CR51_35985 [Caballeronia megalochromosomata]